MAKEARDIPDAWEQKIELHIQIAARLAGIDLSIPKVIFSQEIFVKKGIKLSTFHFSAM